MTKNLKEALTEDAGKNAKEKLKTLKNSNNCFEKVMFLDEKVKRPAVLFTSLDIRVKKDTLVPY